MSLRVEANPEQKEKYFLQVLTENLQSAFDNRRVWTRVEPRWDPIYYSNGEFAYSYHSDNEVHIARVIKESKEFDLICHIERSGQDISLRSEGESKDELTKNLGIVLAKTFNVTLQLNVFDPNDVAGGTLKCKYCGKFTHSAEKCENCGGVPI